MIIKKNRVWQDDLIKFRGHDTWLSRRCNSNTASYSYLRSQRVGFSGVVRCESKEFHIKTVAPGTGPVQAVRRFLLRRPRLPSGEPDYPSWSKHQRETHLPVAGRSSFFPPVAAWTDTTSAGLKGNVPAKIQVTCAALTKWSLIVKKSWPFYDIDHILKYWYKTSRGSR